MKPWGTYFDIVTREKGSKKWILDELGSTECLKEAKQRAKRVKHFDICNDFSDVKVVKCQVVATFVK